MVQKKENLFLKSQAMLDNTKTKTKTKNKQINISIIQKKKN